MKGSNLIPMSERPTDERRELSKRGGVASGAARRERAKFRRFAAEFLNAKTPDRILGDFSFCNFGTDASTLGGAYFCKLWSMFLLDGNLRAAELIFKILSKEEAEAQTDEITDEEWKQFVRLVLKE